MVSFFHIVIFMIIVAFTVVVHKSEGHEGHGHQTTIHGNSEEEEENQRKGSSTEVSTGSNDFEALHTSNKLSGTLHPPKK